MTPQHVHRYAFPIREAIELLLGDDAGDADAWKLRVEDGELVIDIVAPAAASNETAKSNALVEPSPKKPERKGGALAQRAAIMCTEKGFWMFLGVRFDADIDSAELATEWLRGHCGVTSRADLDHDAGAGGRFRDLSTAYGLWLDGHD